MLNYRDPLFSIIVFFILVLIVLIVMNISSYIKDKNRKKYIDEFISQFDFLDDKEIRSIFSDNVSFNSLLLLAIAFEKEGNYEKSLNIYLVLLEHSSLEKKYQILKNMAEVYFKAGFLQKARDSLLEVLRSKPRDKEALKLLLLVNDKLKNYEEIENIIEIFEELDEDILKEKLYLEYQQAFFKSDKEKIRELYKSYPTILKRKYVEFFIKFNPKEVFDEVDEKDVYEMIDIFWLETNLPLKNGAFIQIKAAKKELITTIISPIFEIEVLKHIPKNLGDLEFEYICEECKHLFPFYYDRCPNCKELFSFKVETRLIDKREIKKGGRLVF